MAVGVDWTVGVATVASLVSAVGVIGGGLWAFFHFKKDAPYIARANVAMEADLMTHGRDDLLRVRCSASAVGRGAFEFIRFDEEHSPPSVVAYAITNEVAKNPPQKWVDVCGATEVFVEDDGVESGEVLEDVVLVWVGQRSLARTSCGGRKCRPRMGRPTSSWNAGVPGAGVILVSRRSATAFHDVAGGCNRPSRGGCGRGVTQGRSCVSFGTFGSSGGPVVRASR